MRRLLDRTARLAGVLALIGVTAVHVASPAGAAAQLLGSGSSFAGIEFQQWTQDIHGSPYNLTVNYSSNSSGQGRSAFFGGTVNFAVTDIRYDALDDGTNIPAASSFAYIPMTAGGISFMYNLQNEGFTKSAKPIQLSPETACGIFTGAITNWNDSHIAADNPGVTLPSLTITPVVRSDAAGTNYVLEEYCLQFEPALFAAFVTEYNNSSTVKSGSGGAEPTNAPTSYWPQVSPIVGAAGSNEVAAEVANSNDNGYIGAVETGYADQYGFPVAAVKNDTGAYVLPTSDAVAAALGHATQQNDGTQQLNFAPNDPAAYNPSTYSYMLVSTGGSTSIGASVSEFANYCLTLGQQEAPTLGYASINRSLIQYALQRIKSVVPGAVPATANETAAIPAAGTNPNTNSTGTGSTSSTPTTIGAGTATTSGSTATTSGSTATTSGSTSGSTATTSGGSSTAGASGTTAGTSGVGSTTSSGGTNTGSTGTSSAGTSGAGSSAGTSALGGVNPSVSLGGTTNGPLSQTGVNANVVLAAGLLLLCVGEWWRRLARRRSRADAIGP